MQPPGGGGGGLIGLAPLFHLTEQKGSRLCQTASQCGKRESASGAYVGSASIGLYRYRQALCLFPPATTTVLRECVNMFSFDSHNALVLVGDSQLQDTFDGFQ